MFSQKNLVTGVLLFVGVLCVLPMAWGENLTNLALKKKAHQSSTGYGGDAHRAVDGNRDGNYGANSVSHTNNGSGEWWEVDLGTVRQIKEIRIFNRTDCCGERLADFSVLVSERPFGTTSLDEVLGDSSVWNYRHDGVAGQKTQIPVAVAGRYVRIQLSGANYLSLAEVEVMGESRGGDGGGFQTLATPASSKNIALKKKARQSSTGYGGDAQRAVDGNRDGNYNANSVSHTNNGSEEWWEVDLGTVRHIKEIIIWNRTDCCRERLADFSVLVTEYPFGSSRLVDVLGDPAVWNYRHDGAAGQKTQVPVDAVGRYVRIQLTGNNYLSLAEVEVLGQ